MPLRLRVFSDLHLEFCEFTPPEVACDAVVLAGDTHLGERGVRWAAATFPNVPVVYVLGNHEYYGHAVPRLAEKLRELGRSLGVHVLERDAVTIGDVTFLGATLWTDFTLSPDRTLGMRTAGLQMTDYKKIRVAPDYRRLRPADTGAIHFRTVSWLQHMLTESDDKETDNPARGRTVIVTHHAPSARSLRPDSGDKWLDGAYASPLDDLVEQSGAKLWIHGHTHHNVDYRLGAIRVITNQRGYPDNPSHGFDPSLVIEV